MVSLTLKDIFTEEAVNDALTYLEHKRDSCGLDGLYLSELRTYWEMNRGTVLSDILEERYTPGIVRMEEVITSSGKKRTIAIHNSVDRLILRCMARSLQTAFDVFLHEHCYAFRDRKGIIPAVTRAADMIRNGLSWTVRIDIQDYFDSINLPQLEAFITEQIEDGKLYRLIVRYLHNSVLRDGKIDSVTRGIIQGNPLSPLWSNLYLTSLDRRLDEMGLCFCRYSDDILVGFHSRAEAEAFFPEIARILREDYSLKISQRKSGILESARQQFLGYAFHVSKDGKSVTVFKVKRNRAEVYRDWARSAMERIDRNYHIISDGILFKKDYSILFEAEGEKRHIPVEAVNSINIYSNVIFSGEFFQLAAAKKLNINIFDRYGNLVGTYTPAANGLQSKTMLRQAAVYLDEQKRLETARKMEIGAFHNLRANLRYYVKMRGSSALEAAVESLSAMIQELNEAKNIRQMMLIEGRGRQLYYAMFNEIITNDDFRFTKRTRRPPKDPLNALISFGNTWLYQRTATEINKTRLDIRIGFIHSTNNRSQTLNLDIAELFKPLLVDRAIFTLINKRIILSSKHFENVESGGVYLSKEGKHIFLTELDAKVSKPHMQGNQTVTYDARIRDEIRKIQRFVYNGEPYKPYKYY